MSRKTFKHGDRVEIQAEVFTDPRKGWEPATYRKKMPDWKGWHSVELERDRRVNSMTGMDTNADDPQGFVTRTLCVPTRRVRLPGPR